MTVRELLMRMDSRELSEWQALYMVEAEDHKRAGLRAKAAAANQARKKPGPGRRR